MNALQRRARMAVAIGALAAAGAGTMVAVGTASAAEPAKCVENVKIREEPRIDAPVVAVCEAGTAVEAGEIRNGFVQLVDLGGWSAQEYISINGQRPVKPGNSTGTTSDDPEGPSSSRDTGSDRTADSDGTAPSRDGRATDTTEDSEATPSRSGRSTAEDEEPDVRDSDRSESRTNGQRDAQSEEAAPEKPAGGLPLPLPLG